MDSPDRDGADGITSHPAKLSIPRLAQGTARPRIFEIPDAARRKPGIWLAAPAGAGKTTVVATYITERKLPYIWYQLDNDDADPATFFYYLGLAARSAASAREVDLPLLTPEYLPDVQGFARRYFRNLFALLPPQSVIVLDNTSVTIPTSGSYYVVAIIDDQNAIAEADEGNNTTLLTPDSTSSTLLITRDDFLAGMPDDNPGMGTIDVGVTTAGKTAEVRLAQAPKWTAASSWNGPTVSGWSKPAVGDLNDDGAPDLLVGDYHGILTAFQNIGSSSAPTWTAAPAAWATLSSDCPAGGNSSYKSPVLVDLNGDELLDLVLATRGGVCVYQNTGTAESPTWTLNTGWETGLTALAPNSFYSAAAADLNGDGLVDLMLGQANGGVIQGYVNIGTAADPAWTAMPDWNISTGLSYAAPALADLNGDGRYDLVVGTSASGPVIAYKNSGTVTIPAWTAQSIWNNPTTTSSTGPTFGDLNGDGSLDMLVGDSSGAVVAYKNTGSFAAAGTYLSKVIDAGVGHGPFTTLSYSSFIPSGTNLTVDIRGGDTVTGLVTANAGTGANGSFDSSTYNGSSIPGISGTSPSLTINTDNEPTTIASGDATYPNGAGIYNFTDFTLASTDTVTVTGSKALIIRTNTGNVTIAGTLDVSGRANGAAGPGGYAGGQGAAAGGGPGGGKHDGSSYGEAGGGAYGLCRYDLLGQHRPVWLGRRGGWGRVFVGK
jgi:hypothetical protein